MSGMSMQLGLVIMPYVDYKNVGSSRRHGVLCAKPDDSLWDLADFHERLENRIAVELERALVGLVSWSVRQERAAELEALVPMHESAIVGLREDIEKQRKVGKSLEKKLAAKKKLFSDCFEPDALDSERRAAELMLRDIERQVDRVPETIAGLERTIVQHEAFCAQLRGLISDLRSVRRPERPAWLAGT